MKEEVNEINELVLKLISTGLKSLAKGLGNMADTLMEDLPEGQAKEKSKSSTEKSKERQSAGKSTAKSRKPETLEPAKSAKEKPKTAGEIVLEVIRDAKAVNTATIMEKTGFNSSKVRNNIRELKRKGKIKNKSRGVYVAT